MVSEKAPVGPPRGQLVDVKSLGGRPGPILDRGDHTPIPARLIKPGATIDPGTSAVCAPPRLAPPVFKATAPSRRTKGALSVRPPQAAIPVFKPNHDKRAPLMEPFRSPSTAIPVFKPDLGEGRRIPPLLRRPGPLAHGQPALAVRQSRLLAPYRCPPSPAIAVFKPNLVGGAKVGAPLAPRKSALNPCVQARSGPGAPTSLLGANIRRSAVVPPPRFGLNTGFAAPGGRR
jgi:hypothetical protein